MPSFNYIVTIHNSEQHLRIVLNAVKEVMGENAKVYCVLDGCTDESKTICDEYPFEQIITPDVRETKAITTALKVAREADFTVILQDDVVLGDPEMEAHIKAVYEYEPKIGVLGFRHGINIGDNWRLDVLASEKDVIQNEYQKVFDSPLLKEGFITERQVVYKSPICLSKEVVALLGGYDEDFEPIAHDDTEYCIRAYIHGYKNYVCGLNVDQPLQWGGTRRFAKTHSDNESWHEKHFTLLKMMYHDYFVELNANPPSKEEIRIW